MQCSKRFSHPLLRCLSLSEAEYIMREIHEGICVDHLGGRLLVQKILRQGYCLPTIYEDTHKLKHQNTMTTSRTPPSHVKSLAFCDLGVNILCSFPMAMVQKKFIVVVRNTSHCHHRQWYTVSREIQAVLYKPPNNLSLKLGENVTDQWAGESHKQENPNSSQENVGELKGAWLEELPGIL
ncbi:rve domain-containing protein/RVT_3 domain-containing protein [Gossypium australe]|uniref:Rve domain-containing protein/RVT_3 domain-containing protein n=1 Tax=Gossypium australe TaxID=47621 RepID=A0A5B6U3X0_9ROSI|nr:rve domain-containing protein/RVT_3 domain-containing protein [Gossypium australe]